MYIVRPIFIICTKKARSIFSIHLFNKYLLSVYYVPGCEQKKKICLSGAYIFIQENEQET